MWALFGRLADLAVLSLLWTICSLPVITAGAASAALMRTTLNMHTGEGNWRARHFLRYFRQNIRNATPLWLAFLFALAVLVADLMILAGTDSPAGRLQRSATVLGLILWLITAIWTFALTAQFDAPRIRTVRNAFYLAISWLPRTLLMSALWALPVGLLVFVPYIFSRIVVLWPALFFGGTAYLCARLMIRPLTPYYEAAGVLLSDAPEEDSPSEDL